MLRRSLLLTAAGLCSLPALRAARAAGAGTVNVLYAGSLVNLMEHGVGPAFAQAQGAAFHGFAGGSNGLANQIKGKLRPADVFVSASPSADKQLMGAENGDWVKWYITFASSPLVIGYAPDSKFAADLKSKPFYQVLQEPGLRIVRSDPKLDPSGAFAYEALQKAEKVYNLPGLTEKVLGAHDNPEQVHPEENMVGRMQSGGADVGFFYSTVTTDLKLPFVPLPAEVAVAAEYTVTIPRDPANPAGAEAFVAFLLGAEGAKAMKQHGLDAIAPKLTGDASALPASLKKFF
jgi:molybdate/tungstate transport system substrate-binding protein